MRFCHTLLTIERNEASDAHMLQNMKHEDRLWCVSGIMWRQQGVWSDKPSEQTLLVYVGKYQSTAH